MASEHDSALNPFWATVSFMTFPPYPNLPTRREFDTFTAAV